MKRLYIRMAVALAAVLLAIAFGDAFLSKVSVQRGYDGTGMVLIKDKDDLTAISEKNVAPLVLPPAVGEGTKEQQPRDDQARQHGPGVGGVEGERASDGCNGSEQSDRSGQQHPTRPAR